MSKKKIVIGVLVLVVVVITMSVIIVQAVREKQYKAEIGEDIEKKATELGLKDATVTSMTDYKVEGYDEVLSYNITIDSSNFADLGVNEITEINRELHDLNIIALLEYTCKGDAYEVYSDSSIYKNGENIDPTAKSENSGSSSEDSTMDYSTFQSEVTNGDEIEIWVCAQDIVESNLKSPSSSDFCSVTDAKVYSNGGDNYTVYGYVDAKNGFGAEIRTNFTVTLTYTGSGYTNGVVVFE